MTNPTRNLLGLALSFATLLAFQPQAKACGLNLRLWVTLATSEDATKSAEAIKQLRAAGQPGLDALLKANADAIAAHSAKPTEKDSAWCRIACAIDAVAAQKDAWASGVYWYTDFEQARQAAQAAKKPILSLRLLGTLDTEFSCANSRFFRTALYANKDVSKFLRENFVMHWKSVRPVPKVTIDFGDGRVVERTVTGNSIHYVLDSDGNVIDGIPGLYGPKAFREQLANDLAYARRIGEIAPDKRPAILAAWHKEMNDFLLRTWNDDLVVVGAIDPRAMTKLAEAHQETQQPAVQVAAPTALQAAPRAVGKTMGEIRLVRALTPSAQQLEAATNEELWQKIAERHAALSKLDEGSRVMIVSKNPTALAAGARANTKREVEDPLVKIVRNFEHAMAVDTVRNEYLFHRTIHQWFSESAGKVAVDPLNERVYAELFLTPSSDPWLGLLPADAYSALENEGVRK